MTDTTESLIGDLVVGSNLHITREKAAEYLTRARALGPEWQDISTAPRDGSYIEIFRPSRLEDDQNHIVHWDQDCDGWAVHDGKFWHPIRGIEPTHWRHRSQPPKEPGQ